VEIDEALVGCLCGVAQGGELFRHVTVNDGPECGCNFVPERPGVEREELAFHGLAYIPHRWVLSRVECLDPEFTFAVWGRRIKSELAIEPSGRGTYRTLPY